MIKNYMFLFIFTFTLTACNEKNETADQKKIQNTLRVENKTAIDYEATPILKSSILNETELQENLRLAKLDSKNAIVTLIRHYEDSGDDINTQLWCEKGVNLKITEALFCAAQIEFSKGKKNNCEKAIFYYMQIANQENEFVDDEYAQALGLKVSESEITCEGLGWEKTGGVSHP